MLRKLMQVREAIRYQGGSRALLRARPRSLASWLIANRLATATCQFETILDGGANVGQFARAAHLCFPSARIISFEPLPDVAAQLRANLKDVPKHEVLETALGNQEGTVEFHRNAYSQSSSIRHKLEKTGGLLVGKEEVETLQVAISRIDTLLRDRELSGPTLLKLDLQGHELEALKGAEQTLKRCSYVMLEAVFEQEYEGEALFEEIWRYLDQQHFSFFKPLNFVVDQAGEIVQIDALFRARNL